VERNLVPAPQSQRPEPLSQPTCNHRYRFIVLVAPRPQRPPPLTPPVISASMGITPWLPSSIHKTAAHISIQPAGPETPVRLISTKLVRPTWVFGQRLDRGSSNPIEVGGPRRTDTRFALATTTPNLSPIPRVALPAAGCPTGGATAPLLATDADSISGGHGATAFSTSVTPRSQPMRRSTTKDPVSSNNGTEAKVVAVD
jgi:hypothetical protein